MADAPTPFTHFVGIDWSGAKGNRHPGIAVALCEAGKGTPVVVSAPSGKASWSRQECLDWVSGGCGLQKSSRVLIGVDSAFSMPFVDQGRYLDETFEVSHVKKLWEAVESQCSGAIDLYGGPFVDAHCDHYLRTGERGTKYWRRMRVTETRALESGAGPCESVFHLIGPSQVGLAGLTTMRMAWRLDTLPSIAIWPYDDVNSAPIVVTEIYAAAFAALGGHRGKLRERATLNRVLGALDCSPFRKRNIQLSDHVCDALVTAAALRQLAPQCKYWYPKGLSVKVRETEGWVFGIL